MLRFQKHLKGQNVLDQQKATELMLSCHMTYHMADLLDDMRYRALEFAARERCICFSPGEYPDRFQMQADDLCTLIRDLLGPQFEPKIHVIGVNDTRMLREITLYVYESMELLKCSGKRYKGASTDLIVF
ncbi:hypothetical protein RND81_09G177400 [Saponaria officinalis]|uniref:Uncharacterized protein n=1 Tax=Saponaria officinalis TaxID=3572 RepID=A0AAW1IN95_SAPOF